MLQLNASLDFPLPAELAVGSGTALFVAGTCFCPDGAIADLSVVVDGESQPVIAHSMPRIDFFRSLHPTVDPYATGALDRDPDSPDDPRLLGYASGFWAVVAVRPRAGEHHVSLRATLTDGRAGATELGVIRTAEPVRRHAVRWPGSGPRVAICMATYNPPPTLLARQLGSIRDQTHGNWICVISDDCSAPDGFAALKRAVAGDPRFLLDRAPRRLGYYGNFERALALAPADAEFVALADQDDRWHADKLSELIAALGDAELVYSDARIVDGAGGEIAATYWDRRANNSEDLLSLLVANAVTGAASLFRRELLDYALPFPPAQFAHFHDHWLGLCALALGRIEFVPRPLYDYVQHGSASLGHATATRMVTLSERLRRRRGARERARMWRLHYFVDVCRLLQFAAVLRLRCGDRLTARKRRELEAFVRADRSVAALALLGARGLRELFRSRPETLGAEWMLFLAFVWRRLLSASARPRPQRRLRLDAVPPPSLVLAPGRDDEGPAGQVREVSSKISPLDLAPDADAPARVNILIPTIDLKHFFGGYIALFNLARRLSERGRRVRIVTVDPVPPLPPSWRRTISSYDGLAGVFERVELEFGRGGNALQVSASDRFIASTWWSAHIAAAAAAVLDGVPFVYAIQEYEPFTFPMGTYAALARASYDAPHFALFSSEFLRSYFRAHRIGVYARGPKSGDNASISFQNAITAVDAPRPAELAARRARKLLFYARPEEHAARNMFELGMLALSRALNDGALTGWELNGIGAQGGPRRVPVTASVDLSLLPRAGQAAYAALLRDHDVGLALMYTPHPSLVPIEMASAGMVTVTNTFENKTADALGQISGNLIAAEPTVDGIAFALARAASAAEDFEARAQHSDVAWSRDWEASFGDDQLAWLESVLKA